MSNPWFRFYAEFSGNPVIQSLDFGDQRHFVVLLCLKCNGTLDRPMDPKVRDRIICRGIGLDPMTAVEAKRRLMEVGLIDENWQPSGWSVRQFVSDNSSERVAKHRKNKKTGNVTSSLQKRHGNAPDTDTDTDTDTEAEKHKRAREKPQGATSSFDEFWSAYPTKKGKQDAIRAFAKLDPDEVAQAIADIPARLASDKDWLGGYIPHPATYLNGKRWEDEITPKDTRHEANRKPNHAPRTAAERGEAFGAECWGRIAAQREAGADVD